MNQRWYTVEATLLTGTSVVNSVGIYETTGGVFGRGNVARTIEVGSGELVYTSCSSATFSWRFVAGTNKGKSGRFDLSRLGAAPPGCKL